MPFASGKVGARRIGDLAVERGFVRDTGVVRTTDPLFVEVPEEEADELEGRAENGTLGRTRRVSLSSPGPGRESAMAWAT